MLKAATEALTPVEEAELALKALVSRASRGDAEALASLGLALGAHFALSPRNRLLVAGQSPKARRAWNGWRWSAMGYTVHPEAQGVVVLAPKDGKFVPRWLYTDRDVEPTPGESDLRLDVLPLLPHLEDYAEEEEASPEEAFLWRGGRALAGLLAGKTLADFPGLQRAELALGVLALRGLLGLPGEVDSETVETFRGKPALLMEGLRRVGAAVTALTGRLGLRG